MSAYGVPVSSNRSAERSITHTSGWAFQTSGSSAQSPPALPRRSTSVTRGASMPTAATRATPTHRDHTAGTGGNRSFPGRARVRRTSPDSAVCSNADV